MRFNSFLVIPMKMGIYINKVLDSRTLRGIYDLRGNDRLIFDQRGFSSLAEITLVVGIVSLIFTIGLVSFPRLQQSASLSSIVDIFLADFKEQQIKAMTGDTEGGAAPDYYGIHFNTSSYSLFKGASPSADLNKFVVNLPPPIEVTSTYVDSNGEQKVVFIKGSGEVASWNPSYTITFRDTGTNIQRTIQVEKSGATTLN